MKQALIILICLFNLFSFGQVKKKSQYYFLEFEKISEAEYKNLNVEKFFFKKVENDTSTIQIAYFHKIIRELDSAQLKHVNVFLKGLIGEKFDEKKTSIIHIYNDKKKLYKDVKYEKYWNFIKNNSEKYQSYLIATNELDIENDKDKNIFKDGKNFLKDMFFQGFDFKINHLSIKPNGEVYVYREIDDILKVLDYTVD